MKRLMLTLLTLFSLHALAAPKKQAAEEIGGSEANRQNKTYTLAAQVIGYGPTASLSQGIHFGYFINRNSLLMFELLGSDNPLIWGSNGFTIKSRSLSAHYKYFFGNTFYVKGGLDYKRIDYKYEDTYLGSTYEKTEFVGNSFAGAASIGNQWQFENFTFGVDWFGVSMPFATFISSSSSTGSYPNTKRLDKDEDRFLKENVIILPHIYLGASF